MTETNTLPKIKSLVPWFGGNRMLAEHVGNQLGPLEWVGIPFFGSGPELLHIRARSVVANDLHRHVINLARAINCPMTRPHLLRALKATLFHPDELGDAQKWCKEHQPHPGAPDLHAAYCYFISQWMGRSGKAGTKGEFNGAIPVRWSASGGGSAVRFQSAVRSISAWGQALRRVEFVTLDAIEFLDKCVDNERHGVYCDPPFPDAGEEYKHAIDEAYHRKLAIKLTSFEATRVVCRFYDHPLIRELYREDDIRAWSWLRLKGRKGTNEEAPEVLIVNGPLRATS